MNRSFVFRGILTVVLLLVLAVGAVSIGLMAYNAGVTRGLADSGKLISVPPVGAWLGFGPFVGLLNCLWLVLIFGLVFGLMRRLLWHRHWDEAGGPHGPGYRRWHGPWGWNKGYPPMFDEWHRQAHTQGKDPSQTPPSAPPTV